MSTIINLWIASNTMIMLTNMKKLLLLLLLSLGFIGSANAVSSVDEYFTSLCISESSTGFNWENNDWEKS